MAKSISITSGSILCGSPIMVSVTSELAGSKATFHRVKLIVKAALSTDSVWETYECSAPVSDEEVVGIDISSALRSVASKYVYEVQTENRVYPYLLYSMKAYDEYMIEGILYEKVGERDYGSTLYALMGQFTDIERYLAGTSKGISLFSRKPQQGEICATSETLVYPTPFAAPAVVGTVLASGPEAKCYPLSNKSGVQIFGGHSVYVVPDNGNRIQFQFVNKLGVVESISAETYESGRYEGNSEIDTVTAPGSFKPSRRLLSRRYSKQLVFSLSSGAVTLDWADWWINEFLDCSLAWVKLDDHWIPCQPMVEDAVEMYDKSGNEMCKVLFEVKLSLAGGYRNRM